MLSQAISVSTQSQTQSQMTTTTVTVTVTSTSTPTTVPTQALTTTAQAQQTVTPPMLTSTPTATPTQSQTTTSTVTVTSTSTTTATPTQTTVPTVAAAMMAPVVGNDQAKHWQRVEQLDQVYRSQGLGAWLKAAGLTWDSLNADARQIEEETSPSGRILASGIQVIAVNLRVNWPAIVTTDVPSRITTTSSTVQYQPDARNGSILYTNVVANGPVTVWIDGTNWSQFTSRLGMFSGSQPAVSPTVVLRNTPVPPTTTPVTTTSQSSTTTCLTIAQLDNKYGIDKTAQGASNGLLYDKGVLSGAVLKLTSNQADELTRSGWVIQGTNPSVKSAWSPDWCRPLTQ